MMAGILDMMAQFGAMGDVIEKNKGMLERLPQLLEQWTDLQIEMANAVRRIQAEQSIHIAMTRQILALLDPTSLPYDLAQEVIANAANDPRNRNHDDNLAP